MRQLLLRVPDDLHGRLAQAARERGTSVNALANEILSEVIPAEHSEALIRLREKARQRGVLVERPTPRLSADRRHAALRSTKGVGPVLDAILADGR